MSAETEIPTTRVEVNVSFVAEYQDGKIVGWVVSPWASFAGYMGRPAEVVDGDQSLDVEDTDGPFWSAVQAALAGETTIAVRWEE